MKVWQDKCKYAISRLGTLKLASRAEFCMVADVLLGGLTSFYLQTVAITWGEAEEVEKAFRAAFNRRFARSASSARLQLYGVRQDGKRWRRHVWKVATEALYVVVTECLSEPEDTQARRAARSAVALSLVRWGCRCDPAVWQWEHLEAALQEELGKARVRHLGDAYMLAALMAEKGAPAAQSTAWGRGTARWHFTHERVEGDALRGDAAHFSPPASSLLFEPGSGGLGLRPAEALLEAGMVAVGHYCVETEDGTVRWMETGDEAAAAHAGYRRSALLS